ncbi:MAG TPA: (2Fe-2S)-binding protein [Acidimicrobiales bacterium]|jgi:carbon-monoxide dehydrogenase small subunit|nr:(2Fe-2S)-binding protein [Acidimicrobiales bacterium]
MKVVFTANGMSHELDLEPRELLADVLRDRLDLRSVHIACEQGACGTCTVLVDGRGVRSCLMFGVQVAGCEVSTVEAIGSPADLHPIQRSLSEHHGLQCGFCTPGMVLAAVELLRDVPSPTTAEIEEALAGNLCRCTGYVSIVDAIAAASGTTTPGGDE